MKTMLIAAVSAMLSATPVDAQTVDGKYDAAYGAAKSMVTLNPALATGDFSSPTSYAEATGYSIYITSDANFVYGFLKADTAGAGAFANVYFDLDPANGNGSDLGFEITNDRAFVPGRSGYAENLAGLDFAISDDRTGIEFSIANSLLTSKIAGLNYYDPQTFPTTGSDVVLRLSQSFNYSVAGGPSYGDSRLGRVTIGGNAPALPEPASWAMMILGMGMVGWALRGVQRRSDAKFDEKIKRITAGLEF